jgi:hypothetical protein
MKTVQQERLQFVQPHGLNRKRKRSPVKPSDLKPKEDLKIKRTTSTTGAATRRVKRRRQEPLFIRASPRLLALKAKLKADENHEENIDCCNATPGLSNSSAPDLNGVLNFQPDPNSEEVVEANGISTRTQLQSVKLRKERPIGHRASPRLAALKSTSDTSSIEHDNSMASNALIESSHSCLSYQNTIVSSQADLQLKDETIEGTNGSSTSKPPCQGKMHTERHTSLRDFHLAAQKVTTDTTSIKNKNSMMSNALLEPSSSLSHLNVRSTSHQQPGCEETIEWADGSLNKTRPHRGVVHKERRTHLRAFSHIAVQKVTIGATSVENENSTMSDALFGPLHSPRSYPNLRPTCQPDLEPKKRTIEGAYNSSTTPLYRRKMHKEKPTPTRASSHLAAMDATTDDASVENKNSVANYALSNPPHSFSSLNVTYASQPDLELKDEKIQAVNGSSTGTPLQRGKKNPTKGPVSLETSHQQVAFKVTAENKNSVANYAISNPPHSFSSLNVTYASQPDLELKDEKIQAVNGSSTGTPLQRGKKNPTKGPVSLETSHQQVAFKVTAECTAGEYEDSSAIDSCFEPPTSRPDLNLGSTSVSAMEFEEVMTAANGRGPWTILQKEKLLKERPPTISSCTSALRSTSGTTSDENHGEGKRTRNAVSELSLAPAHPDLNFGPTNQPCREPNEDALNGSEIETLSWRVEPHRDFLTSVNASPCLEALKVATEAASNKSNEKNSMAASAWSEPLHFPGRPDLNLGPTSELAMERQEQSKNANATGTASWTTNLQGVRPAPVTPAPQAPSYYNHGNNIKISNYFRGPVESSASPIIMGSSSQVNLGEVWLHTAAATPSTVIAVGRKAPDLNMAPVSWPEPECIPEYVLEANHGPKLEQQQPPAGVNALGEFHLQPPIHSEMPYQDPTMDALLSGQEVGPSMPHMSIDAFNSPVSPFFGDFWHDPCLSYAFRTLTGGARQQQVDLGLGPGPENNVNRAGPQNGGSSGNSNIGLSVPPSRTLQYMNNGMPFPK